MNGWTPCGRPGDSGILFAEDDTMEAKFHRERTEWLPFGQRGRICEACRRIGDPGDRFDMEFWQSQGERVIFEAALEMISDYMILRWKQLDQPGLQRTVESFGKA